MTQQRSRRPGYMRWFFPALLGFFVTLLAAVLLLWRYPGLWPRAAAGVAAADQELMAERHREADLRNELALLGEEFSARLARCAPPQELEPLAFAPLAPPEAPDVAGWETPEAPPAEVAELPPDSVREPEPETVPADPGQDRMDNLDQQQPEPSSDELQIPEDAEQTGNLDFLKGCWISETGLTNRDTGQPVTVRYCFDANGNGFREVQDVRGPCRGGANARIQPDGSLAINLTEAPCSFGDVTYVEGFETCTRDPQGKTHCFGQGGGVNWRSHFRRER